MLGQLERTKIVVIVWLPESVVMHRFYLDHCASPVSL